MLLYIIINKIIPFASFPFFLRARMTNIFAICQYILSQPVLNEQVYNTFVCLPTVSKIFQNRVQLRLRFYTKVQGSSPFPSRIFVDRSSKQIEHRAYLRSKFIIC